MKKITVLLLAVLFALPLLAQPADGKRPHRGRGLFAKPEAPRFPASFLGHWKGTMLWYRGTDTPKAVPMELHIMPTDSAGKYTWQLIYGEAREDNRPYHLIAKDSAKGHWVIDEHDGIILDQFWVGNCFTGAFTVQSSTIVNNYRIENHQLIVEFYSIGAKPIARTGKGDDETPYVDSYKIGSYQRAVLKKEKSAATQIRKQ
jgi:hypothetical protein